MGHQMLYFMKWVNFESTAKLIKDGVLIKYKHIMFSKITAYSVFPENTLNPTNRPFPSYVMEMSFYSNANKIISI